MNKVVNVEALFLGPQSENHHYFKELLDFMIDEHIHWRRNFHPNDKPSIAVYDQQSPGFRATVQRTHEVLLDLSSRLKTSSMPWHSPRYLGHMASDILMPAVLAYMATMLYNPNNCAYEGSPATTGLEIEAGKDLAQLLGFDRETAWGHITSGGTVANYEGLWVARNLKSMPMALKKVRPSLVRGMDAWQLVNLPPSKVFALMDKARSAIGQVQNESVRGRGLAGMNLGKVLVPQSKHYSWIKAFDVLGLGQDSGVSVQVKENYRMDIADLRHKIEGLVRRRIPILAVIPVVGSTEEGAVDEVHRILQLRELFERRHGVSFYIHVDAAYGGYGRSLFMDENNRFMSMDRLRRALRREGILTRRLRWPSQEVYRAYKALEGVDSVTIDPHKLGYVPYQAGAVVFRDKRVRDLVSHFAPYVFEERGADTSPQLLGSYIMEGSKAGAAAASVWAAHRCVPLNITGYGKIIGNSIKGAFRFYSALKSKRTFTVDGQKVRVEPLTVPDCNIVVYAFNLQGNKDLAQMNDLNERIYDQCSYKSGPIYTYDFITSKTSLEYNEYGDAPGEFVGRLGIPRKEWDRVRSVYVLRSCVTTPYLGIAGTREQYIENFVNAIQAKLTMILGGK
ncbi:MAG: pyridoxal-dependent decarboxylase [Planctomycetota bacterium]